MNKIVTWASMCNAAPAKISILGGNKFFIFTQSKNRRKKSQKLFNSLRSTSDRKHLAKGGSTEAENVHTLTSTLTNITAIERSRAQDVDADFN